MKSFEPLCIGHSIRVTYNDENNGIIPLICIVVAFYYTNMQGKLIQFNKMFRSQPGIEHAPSAQRGRHLTCINGATTPHLMVAESWFI